MKQLIALFLLLLVTSCAPLVKDGQAAATNVSQLSADQTLGQTFLARDSGLQGVEIFMRPENAASGEIRLHLRSGPQSQGDLAISVLPSQSVTTPGWVRFNFPAQSDSRQKDYYFLLKVRGNARLLVENAPGDSYQDGALYQNGAPLDGQMTFRLVYRPQQMAVGLFFQLLNWMGILGIGIFLFILPGWALLMALWPGWSGFSWGEKAGLAAGLSLALYPLLFLWTTLIGLRLGALYAWLPGLTALSFILWQQVSGWQVKKWKVSNLPPSTFHLPTFTLRLDLPDLALFVLLALVIFTRFWVIRSLDLPLWGDSYQHTMIAQLLVDNGGLFNSWLPYAELQSFTYHFGFHSAVAVFHWLSGLNLAQSMLWTGQLINILAVLALYPLTLRLSANRWAGVGAVLVAGLLAPMPMYYLNWGRYTQLAGQVILPAAISLAWLALENAVSGEKATPGESIWSRWRRLLPLSAAPTILIWLLWGGLALTHYRVLIFGIPFFAAFFLLKATKIGWKTLLAKMLWLGAGAGALFLPWFLHTFAGKILLIFSTQLTTPAQAVAVSTQQYNSIGDLTSYLPLFVWLLLPISLLWGLWRKNKSVALMGLWWLLILLAANPQWLRLPGEGALSNFAVFIAAYIPVGALAGFLLGQVESEKWKVGSGNILALVMLVLVLGMAVWGARQRLKDFQPAPHALAVRPDIRAATWIRENTPQDARFLVNSMFAYGDTVIVGTDGGWWLPLLAQRQTTLPPLNYSSEQGPRPDYVQWINALTTEIQNKGIAHPDVLALLRERGVTHVYIGQRQGRVNYGGPYVLELQQLLANPNFRLVYHQDRVWVFEIVR